MVSVKLEQETRRSESGMIMSAECEVRSLRHPSATHEHDLNVIVLSPDEGGQERENK